MKIYVNTKFDTYQTRKSGKHYVKISFLTDKYGMFAVIGNVDDNKVSIQSFNDITNEHIYGLSDTNNYTENDFYTKIIMNLDGKTKNVISDCVRELNRSFRNHVIKNQYLASDSQEQSAIFQEIKDFSNRFTNAFNLPPNQVVNNSVEKWNMIDDIVSQISAEELNNIVSTLNKGEKAIFSGKEYRIIDENGRAVLQYRILENTNVVENKIPDPVVITKQRKKMDMAYMKDSDGLNEFVNGHFYTIRENNGNFVKVLNENGEERYISRDRISIVSVFAEPPFEETATA